MTLRNLGMRRCLTLEGQLQHPDVPRRGLAPVALVQQQDTSTVDVALVEHLAVYFSIEELVAHSDLGPRTIMGDYASVHGCSAVWSLVRMGSA